LYTISLTGSFVVGMEIPGFAVSVLPGPPTGVVGVEAVASPLPWADLDELLPSVPGGPEDDEDGGDDDDDDDEYRSKLNTQYRDREICETGRKFTV